MFQVKEQEDILHHEQTGGKYAVLTVYFGHEHRRFLPKSPSASNIKRVTTLTGTSKT